MIPHIEMPGMVLPYARCVDAAGEKVVYMTTGGANGRLQAEVKFIEASGEVLAQFGLLNCNP